LSNSALAVLFEQEEKLDVELVGEEGFTSQFVQPRRVATKRAG
jgi:hypothetical protein